MPCYVSTYVVHGDIFCIKNNFVGLPFKPDADVYMVVAHNVVRMPRPLSRTLPFGGNTRSFCAVHCLGIF